MLSLLFFFAFARLTQGREPTNADAENYLRFLAYSGNIVPNCLNANAATDLRQEFVETNVDTQFLAYGFFLGQPLYHGTGNTGFPGNEIFSPSFFGTSEYYPSVHTFAGDFFPFGGANGYCAKSHFGAAPGIRTYDQQASTEPDFLIAQPFEMEKLASVMRCGANVGACNPTTANQKAVQEYMDKLQDERVKKQKYISDNVAGARVIHRMWNAQNAASIRGVIQQRTAKASELKALFQAAYARETTKVLTKDLQDDKFKYITDISYFRSSSTELDKVTDNEIDVWLTAKKATTLQNLIGHKWSSIMYYEVVDFAVPTWKEDVLFKKGASAFSVDDTADLFLGASQTFLDHCEDKQFSFSVDYQTWYPSTSYQDRNEFIQLSKNDLRSWNLAKLWPLVVALPGNKGKGTKLRKLIELSSTRALTLAESQQLQTSAQKKWARVLAKKGGGGFFLDISNTTKRNPKDLQDEDQDDSLEPM